MKRGADQKEERPQRGKCTINIVEGPGSKWGESAPCYSTSNGKRKAIEQLL